jgi:TolB-like protein
MRVTAQLIDAVDGIHLWSQKFDHELSDLLNLQGDITDAIATSLKRYLHPAPEWSEMAMKVQS